MSATLEEVAPPEWMLKLFKSIDALDFSPGSGFEVFSDDIDMQFGPSAVKGIEAVEKFFVKLDAPFITEHFVDKVLRYGNAFVMQGSASLRKKGDPVEKTFTAAPLFNLIWLNDEGKIIRYVVDFPPNAAEASGLSE